MEYEGGWIKIWRKLLKNPVFKNNDPCLFKTFIYCLCRANHKETSILLNGQEIILKPGEFITGRFEASNDLNFKSIMWDRKIKVLENMGIMNRQANNQFSKISIMNWDSYQGSSYDDEQVSEQRMNNLRTTYEQPMNTDKNVKNVKKNRLSDEEFLFSLKEKFTWVDFDQTMVRIDAWLLAHPNRKKTRPFIVSWFNKIEKPMEVKSGKSW